MSSAMPQYPMAERQRKLQAITFAPGQTLSRDLPKDTVLKSLQLRLSGAVQTTYASGTPVTDAQATFDNLVNRIEVVVDGSRTVKSVRPHLMRMQQLLVTQIAGERLASAGASPALDNLPLADGGFLFGTTTQYTTVAESIFVYFEMIHSEPGMGRESTWLNLKGRSSAELKISTAQFSNLQGFGNTAPVVYGLSTIVIDVITREAQDVDSRMVFSDWRQTTKAVSFSAETKGYPIDISRGNKLTGLMLFARDGQAGSATTATGKVPSNLLITNLSVILNGQTVIKATDFKALQAENRAQYGISSPRVAGVSSLDGVAHLNFLARRDLSTALSVEPPNVDNCQLYVDTNNSTNISYTFPAELTIMTEELVYPR